MKRVVQTRFGKGTGNCFQAVLASIFEIDINAIPYFQDADDWYSMFREWAVETLGLDPVDLGPDSSGEFLKPRGYYIINGRSPRGNFDHSVVGWNGEMVHDPHVDGTGLRSVTSITVFMRNPGAEDASGDAAEVDA